MDKASIPQALFSCHFECCQAEVSYPADMLRWCETEKGWVCDNCFDHVPEDCEPGITLAEYIAANQLTAVSILGSNRS